MPGGPGIPVSPAQILTGQHRYALGAVKPYVRDAAQIIGDKFDVKTVYGVGLRPDLSSDHPKGLALDFMVYTNRAKGDAIASFVQQNAASLHVTYIIWYQRIWDITRSSEGWRAMPDRGSVTANHKDHVHVSFQNIGGNSLGNLLDNVTPDAITNPLGDVVNTLKPVAGAVAWLSSSTNLLRVAMFIGGGALLLIALIGWAAVQSGVVNGASKLTKAKVTPA
jgi:hypothetical protein